MAGTANNFRVTGRVLGPGILWGGLPVVSASARLTLATVDSDGFITPDATANPAAYPIGATKSGVVCEAKADRTDFYADEIMGPVDSKIQQVSMMIKADLYGIMDSVVSALVMAGFGTYSTASGYKQNTVGYVADAFTGIALIAPQREDPTKVFVFHMYKAICTSGLTINVNKSELAASPTEFRGYAISTRTPADQMGNYWWQIA
jgi:hypothetical protein